MVILVEAIKNIKLQLRSAPKTKNVSLFKGVNHIIAKNVHCQEDLPPLPKSIMDGFVVCSKRERYEIKGEISLLSKPPTYIKDNEAYQVYTGSLLPNNSLYVIKKELASASGGTLFVKSESAFEKNFLDIGEDCKKGDIILKKGEVLSSRAALFLGVAGIKKVTVFKKPKIAILPIGTELIGKSGPDLTGFTAKSFIESMMAKAELFDPVPDSVSDISNAIVLLSKKYDVLLTIGGTGVSSKDLTENAVLATGGKIIFKGINIQPGRTTGFFTLSGKPIITLPGNAQAAVAALFVLLPITLQVMGYMPYIKRARVHLKQKVLVEKGLTKIIFIKLIKYDGCTMAEPLNIRPHTLKFLLETDALLITNKSIPKGSLINVLLI